MEKMRLYKDTIFDKLYKDLSKLKAVEKGSDKNGDYLEFTIIDQNFAKALEEPKIEIPITEYDVDNTFKDIVDKEESENWSFKLNGTEIDVNLLLYKGD